MLHCILVRDSVACQEVNWRNSNYGEPHPQRRQIPSQTKLASRFIAFRTNCHLPAWAQDGRPGERPWRTGCSMGEKKKQKVG